MGRKLLQKTTKLKCCVVTEIWWNKKDVSRASLKTTKNSLPRLVKKGVMDTEAKVSTSWAEIDKTRAGLHLADFLEATSSAAAPDECEVQLTYKSAIVCATVTSLISGLPNCHGTSIIPPRCLPSPLPEPVGCLVAGMPAKTKALLKTLMSGCCLVVRPNASLHVKPCKPPVSTWDPQQQMWEKINANEHTNSHVDRLLI